MEVEEDETQVLKRREERGEEEKDRAITVNLVFAFNTCREEVMRREGGGEGEVEREVAR